MTPEQRILALERELADTRSASARMVADIIRGLVETEAGRAEVADDLLASANDSRTAPIEARLARLMAAALRG
ncbi:hypothetical protein [Pseudooceanicola atlanticus]|uniref:Uncharacterized protein n=1 Tax=Pseudooceanicola atlanticus TaxID=1461694 RepID=A0A0A0EK14_9RHOB|nr:hypothetical protein [Pseudooceanicola atlanticus]KGM50645.1 hypothetical protein ATO9_03975 [Pseudooceanicola atlanticus]